MTSSFDSKAKEESQRALCPVCGVESVHAYSPKNSYVGLEIYVCPTCELVHSTRLREARAYSELSTQAASLSCDADYSTGRVGKEQMTRDNTRLFGHELRALRPTSVLDVAAARGHFLQFASKEFGGPALHAMDPNPELLGDTASVLDVEILVQDFRNDLNAKRFDLIYSCHSLEHYRNPLEQLGFIKKHLAEEGRAVIDVPDFDCLDLETPIDEFFYDQHRTYFSCRTLKACLTTVGLRARRIEHFGGSLKALVTHDNCQQEEVHECPLPGLEAPLEKIRRYAKSLKLCRDALPRTVREINMERGFVGPLVAIGAGRILDAAVRYGNLHLNDFELIVDSFLYNLTAGTDETRIVSFKSFCEMKFHNTPLCIIFANSSTDQIKEELKAAFPEAKVIAFRDVLFKTLRTVS